MCRIFLTFYPIVVLYMDNIPTWLALVVSVSIGLIVGILVQLFVVPWQRRKILNHENKRRTEFTVGDSDCDSSSNGSPRRPKRPLSLVGDAKGLPAITETTELVSLSSQHQHNGLIKKLSIDLSPSVIKGTSPNPYKIDPKIVQKAENLLAANKASLDNTDLTITSLNYIDEYQSTMNGTGRMGLNSYFDRRNSSNLSPKSHDSVTMSNGVK